MGKKYIIEIPEDKITDFVGSTHFLMPYMMAGHIGHHDTGLPIEPYTEPDLEQVRKEAYQKGYETGYEDGYNEPGKNQQEAYQRGLSDAWEAARKIIHMPEGDLLNVFTECYSAVCTALQVILKYNASEAIEKLKTYEQEQDEIQVGDEVRFKNTGSKFVVTRIFESEEDRKCEGLFDDGEVYESVLDVFDKTGRHFPEIAAVLEKMRGEQDG